MNSILKNYYEDLGITATHLSANQLDRCEQAQLSDLEVVDIDFAGRPFLLTSKAATAWRQMQAAAVADRIVLNPASGFRSYLYQKKLIENHLAKGRTLEDILKGSAIPGYSEHHTGRAVDICDDPSIPESEFHQTDTFAWMQKKCGSIRFST